MDAIKFNYNTNLCLLSILFAMSLIVYSFTRADYFFRTKQVLNGELIVGMACIFCLFIIALVVKILIPAMRGVAAIELNEEGVIDNIRNNLVAWEDIESIDYDASRSTGNIILRLNKYNDYYTVYLSMVKGGSSVIYDEFVSYFEKVKKTGYER